MKFIKFSLLPIFMAIYPVVFHYSNNVNVAAFQSAFKLSIVFAIVAVLLYGLIYLIGRFRAEQAANATFAFLLFFHTYGIVYFGLRKWDIIQVEHYTLLPLFFLCSVYLAWIVIRLSSNVSINLWKGMLIVIGSLLVFNFINVWTIVGKEAITKINEPPLKTSSAIQTSRNYPDIYFIIFDEMAGFEAVRQYWHYNKVDDFVEFLQSYNFYVAENSHASSPSTMNQMASRLNYDDYPYIPGHRNIGMEQEAIVDNKVMRYLKSMGYTTVAFTEVNSSFLFAGMPSMKVDFLYEQPDNENVSRKAAFIDDFMLLVLKNTMFLPFVDEVAVIYPAIEQHREMIYYTIEEVPSLNISSPKFVYVHLALPHTPFIFDKSGRLVAPKDYYNWNNYLGQYIYSIHLAQELIKNILDSTNGEIPPVVIFQSDHGARNLDGAPRLENYPEEYKTWIVNAILLPGCDDAPLSQDMNPTNTFPIVFNCYFDDNILLK